MVKDGVSSSVCCGVVVEVCPNVVFALCSGMFDVSVSSSVSVVCKMENLF